MCLFSGMLELRYVWTYLPLRLMIISVPILANARHRFSSCRQTETPSLELCIEPPDGLLSGYAVRDGVTLASLASPFLSMCTGGPSVEEEYSLRLFGLWLYISFCNFLFVNNILNKHIMN